MQDLLELLLKRVDALEKKLERYYSMLKVDNELDFIMRGTYITDEDINKIWEGRL